MTKIVPVILAGGSGTRLWPVLRDALPKQFLPLVGERSTYQDTLRRVAAGDLFAPPIVITGADFRFFARRQAEEIGIEPTVVIEPMRRDSGPALAAAAVLARNRDPDAVVLALAADHVILNAEEFRATCAAALKAAQDGRIVTFGIPPSAPKSSYGYIRRGTMTDADEVFVVEAFVEKPDAETAARYVAQGYLWNSGNFLFRADVLLAELDRYEPAMVAAVEAAVAGASNDLGFVRLVPEAFAAAPQKSIDYAVMEKTDRAAVIAGNFGWSDIGSWDAIFDIGERDKSGNVTQGAVVMADTRKLRDPFSRPAYRGTRRRGSCRGVDARRRPGGASGSRARGARTGRHAKKSSAAGGDRASPRPSTLGLLRFDRSRRTVSGQADRGTAGRDAVAAKASSSGRTLGRGARHCRGHHRIRDEIRA